MMINTYRYTNREGNYFTLFTINLGFLGLNMTSRKQALKFHFWFNFFSGHSLLSDEFLSEKENCLKKVRFEKSLENNMSQKHSSRD